MIEKKASLDDEFRENGFLSPNIHLIELNIRAEIGPTVSLLRSINNLMTKIVNQCANHSSAEHTLEPSVIGIASGLRTLGHLQGAITLFERGMATEAKILTRCIYENSFCIGALGADPVKFVEMLEKDNHAAKLGIAKILDTKGVTELQSLKLSNILTSKTKGQSLNIKVAADLTDLKEAYLFYKYLSNDSAHHSATSLSKHLVTENSEWSGFVYGPAETEDLNEVAFYCANASLLFMIVFSELLKTEIFQEEIMELWQQAQTITLA